MAWFYATSVSVTNGATVVSVNAGDDIAIIQPGDGLVIGTQPPVEVKRTYLDGSSNKKIELLKPWPYGSQSNQPAEAYPTAGDFQAATAVLKQLIESFELATQAEAQAGTENTKPMTALRVKQALDALLGTASKLNATTSETDRTTGRALRVGDHGNGTTFRGRVDVLGGQTPAQIVALHGEGFIYNGTIQNHGSATPEAWGIISGYITSGNAYSYTYQEFTGIYAGKWRRTAQSGGNGWNLWVPVYDGANSLGTVAFSSGVNTGAIIERGSNANGEYIKFADGTLICWGTPLVIANQLANGNVGTYGWSYYYENNSVLFPASFASAPSVQVTPQGAFLSALVISASATAFVVAPVTTVLISAGAPIMYTAVGRWR